MTQQYENVRLTIRLVLHRSGSRGHAGTCMEVVNTSYTQTPTFNHHVVAASAHGDNIMVSPITRVHDDVILIAEGGRKRV